MCTLRAISSGWVSQVPQHPPHCRCVPAVSRWTARSLPHSGAFSKSSYNTVMPVELHNSAMRAAKVLSSPAKDSVTSWPNGRRMRVRRLPDPMNNSTRPAKVRGRYSVRYQGN